jgi:hypothetical protein
MQDIDNLGTVNSFSERLIHIGTHALQYKGLQFRVVQ